MPKQKKQQPVEPDQLSRALAKSLSKLDKVLARQRREIIDMAELVTLTAAEAALKCRGALGSEARVDDALLARLTAAVRASFSSLEQAAEELELPELEHDAAEGWDDELRQAVSMAWQNAVEASQSLQTVAEQALIQGLSLLFSVAGDALTEKQELVLDALTPSSAVPGYAAGAEDTRFRDEVGFDDPFGRSSPDGDADEDEDDWA